MMQRLAPILLLVLFSVDAFAQAEPTPEEILNNLKKKFELVKDYTADISTEVHFEKMRIPKMEAKVYSKQPDKVHFEPKSGSFAMFPREAVGFNPSLFVKEQYDAVVQGREIWSNVNCYKLKLLAKADSVRLQRITLFVDPEYWIIKKIVTSPQRGGDVEVQFVHQLIDNTYLMPVKITLFMEAPSFGKKSAQGATPPEIKKGSVVVTYSNYVINKGISDSIFKPKDKEEKK